jgi:hypothetical protein
MAHWFSLARVAGSGTDISFCSGLDFVAAQAEFFSLKELEKIAFKRKGIGAC